jgi:hypothetical protein
MLEKDATIYKYKLVDNQHLFNKDVMNLQIEGWNTEIPMNYNNIICIRTEDYLKPIIDEIPPFLERIQCKRHAFNGDSSLHEEHRNHQNNQQ